jgi:hypothetical protein
MLNWYNDAVPEWVGFLLVGPGIGFVVAVVLVVMWDYVVGRFF